MLHPVNTALMIILAFHTAGPACDLAFVRDGQVVSQRQERMARGQDARLPDLTQTVLDEAGLGLAEIDRFAVVTGPGSFTGIRVGVAFARGLALATGAPCIGVTSLEAALPRGQQGSAIVALPAQKRPPDITFWTQTFRTGMATDAAKERRASDLVQLLEEHPHNVFGDRDALTAILGEGIVHAAAPSAAGAALHAARLDPETRRARPTYARAPDAALPGSRT
ncbi:MAG: tRNA (adenosine(37)-N6)-threonylcarbamoyltransferase complex dimerization subunit type 1 TsaB [Henriciella sp.]